MITQPIPPPRILPRPIQVVAVSDNTSSGYHRVVAPLALLGKMELIEYRLTANPADIEWADLIFWQRPTGMEAESQILDLKAQGKLVFVEADDHFEAACYGLQSRVWTPIRLMQLQKAAVAAHGILVTTPGLVKYWKDKGANPILVPQCIDHMNRRWASLPAKPGSGGKLGWMGGDSHQNDLEIIRPPASGQLPGNFKKLVIAGFKPTWADEYKCVEYREPVRVTGEPMLIHDFDVGLVPLEDNEFNAVGKSDLKFLQYTMVNAVTVASKVGVYNDLKEYLCLTDNIWETVEMLKSTKMREKKLKKAKEYVLAERTLYAGARRWYEAFILDV